MRYDDTKTMRLAAMLGACVLSSACATPSAAQTGSGDTPCAAATKAGFKYCSLSGNGTYALALGTCANILDRTARSKCLDKAQKTQEANESFCNRQRTARTGVCVEVGQDAYDPQINPADFGRPITNTWLPMIPGTIYTYSVPNGVDTVKVTHSTVNILGVDCVQVEDIVTIGGQTEEHTFDYFTQDKSGNVWYFGEDSQQWVNGQVAGVVGSWRGGVNGAKPGIIMEAKPKHGDAYRQEFALGVAEDSAEVDTFDNTVSVPYGTFNNAMKTFEFSGLEPGSMENKYYVPKIGNVLVVDLQTGERDELLSIKHY